ncbi:GrpB family protein [Actinoalloteichus spitiensis]|uniref:GrpB family protein n=1 Tax=Actinoalloteichus spitiensis TaxID=252394 RepID=UPI0002E8F6DA|nr:GrpB family protein [Actinoalloteichus spitiensis]
MSSTGDEQLAEVTVGAVQPHDGTIEIVDPDPRWPQLFSREATRIREALGDRALAVEHVGSTSVPSLAAKPILDIVLAVADSAAEADYVPDLEAAGYVLRIREPDWFQHRLLKGTAPEVNLHVFTAGCPEIDRMTAFRDHLRGNARDRQRYEAVKRDLARRTWRHVQDYADAKGDIVQEIHRAIAGGGRPSRPGA